MFILPLTQATRTTSVMSTRRVSWTTTMPTTRMGRFSIVKKRVIK
nr:MAG TPA: hypothetical protein [Caudoviricetes sp.]